MKKPLTYYNEIDPFAAAWLRELIKAGHIAPGVVDERSIKEVKPEELEGYTQCHFFAGIGVWSYALRLAGWPDDRPIWTGSCPCPSFSAAGKGQGFNDPRHLWPDWFRLIRESKPTTIFGEQVDGAIGHGWFDVVQTDLEAQGYAVGKAVLGACSVGAPHIRKRVYFVADSECEGLEGTAGKSVQQSRWQSRFASGGATRERADTENVGWRHGDSDDDRTSAGKIHAFADDCQTGSGAHADERGHSLLQRGVNPEIRPNRGGIGAPHGFECNGIAGECGNAQERGLGVRRGAQGESGQPTLSGATRIGGVAAQRPVWPHDGQPKPSIGQQIEIRGSGATRGFWANCDWWYGRDGKYRPTQSGLFPLAHGAAARVGRLRGYGNALVAQVAEAFIRAFVESIR
jgi:DNA (cytosine-5)-methyltransferase 1